MCRTPRPSRVMRELGEDGHRLGELPRGLPHGQAQEFTMSVMGRECRASGQSYAERQCALRERDGVSSGVDPQSGPAGREDRKSTRLNSSHVAISYAVFCLKKKKNTA